MIAIPAHLRPLLASVVALLLLYGFAAIRYYDDGFVSTRVILNLLNDNAVLGVVAVGMTFVILSGGIDLSVGAMMGLASIVIAVLVTKAGWHPLAAMIVGVGLTTTLGALMGGLIHVTGIKPFIVTLAGMFFARGLGFCIHLESLGITAPTHQTLAATRISLGSAGSLRLPAILFLGFVLVGTYVATMTRFGRGIHALGGSEEASRLMGIRPGRLRVALYALSGLCSGSAGALLTLYLSAGNHLEGVGLELDAIAAVVVGGTLLTGGVGSVIGTLVGVLIIGVILTIVTFEPDFSAGLTRVVIGGLLLIFVLIQRTLISWSSRTKNRAI